MSITNKFTAIVVSLFCCVLLALGTGCPAGGGGFESSDTGGGMTGGGLQTTFTADDEVLLRQLCESVSHAMSDWSTHQRALDRLSATNAGLTLMEQTLLESRSELAKRQREDVRKDELMREGARLVSETSSLDDLFIRVVEDARHIVGAERRRLYAA